MDLPQGVRRPSTITDPPHAGHNGSSTGHQRAYLSTLTARAMTSNDVSSAATLCTAISTFAREDSGIVSVGLNAVELVTDTYR